MEAQVEAPRAHRIATWPAGLDRSKLPQHLAVLLNEQPGVADSGIEAVHELIECVAELGVPYLTICAAERVCAQLRQHGAEAPRQGLRLRLNSACGRDQLVQVARQIAQEVKCGELAPAMLDAKLLDQHLHPEGEPDPDLLICTGDRPRVGGYLLWQMAYAEIYVSPEPWHRFGWTQLLGALVSFQGRERRFGKVPAPAAKTLSKAG